MRVVVTLLSAFLLLPACDGLRRAEARDSGPHPPSPPPSGTVAASPPTRCGGCLSIERCSSGRCVPDCPAGEVYIPATGPNGFTLGRDLQDVRDRSHTVVLTRPFCMDQTEVSVAQYRDCVAHRGCEVPKLFDVNSNYRFEREDHPVNMVHFDQAMFYCKSLGKTVPTEAQWIWAAGHGDGRKYPWGDEDPTCENERADFTPGGAPKSDPAGDVGCGGGNTSPVGSHPRGRSSWPTGDLFDLGGNVWEWTRDCSLPFGAERQVDPNPTTHPRLGDGCWVFALVGGGWNRSATALEVGWRAAARRNYQVPGLGFRCIREPAAVPRREHAEPGAEPPPHEPGRVTSNLGAPASH